MVLFNGSNHWALPDRVYMELICSLKHRKRWRRSTSTEPLSSRHLPPSQLQANRRHGSGGGHLSPDKLKELHETGYLHFFSLFLVYTDAM